jgi:hypothetical protein
MLEVEASASPEPEPEDVAGAADGAAGAAGGAAAGVPGEVAVAPPPQAVSSPTAATPPAPVTTARRLRPGRPGRTSSSEAASGAPAGDGVWVMEVLAWWERCTISTRVSHGDGSPASLGDSCGPLLFALTTGGTPPR